MSSGDCTIVGGITKHGNRYLRTLFMRGARVILLRSANWAKHSSGLWLTAAAQRLHHNVLAPALANKWLGSLGLCWHKVAATQRASSRKLHKISVFGPADVQG